jgi:hypothetical protein
MFYLIKVLPIFTEYTYEVYCVTYAVNTKFILPSTFTSVGLFISVDITFDEISISVETRVSDDTIDFSMDRLS